MSKKIRDVLFFIFIALFIVGTILVSLYATGYRIELSWPLNFNRLLIKTGIISVKSNPEGAAIYLNRRLQKNFSFNLWNSKYLTTPSKIKNVLPGKYDLTLKIPGYLPLSNKITVQSGQTTFAENINLFKSNLPQLLVKTKDSSLLLSDSGHYIYLTNSGQIANVNNGNLNRQKVPPLGTWLNGTDQIFAGGRVFDVNGRLIKDFSDMIGNGATDWYYDQNQSRVYYILKNSLNYWDINNQTAVLIINGETCLSYKVSGNDIFLVAIKNGQTVLQDYSLNTKKIEQEAQLPTIGHYNFGAINSRLTLNDSLNNTLYLIDPVNITSGLKTVQGITSWQWLNNQTILFSNNWEIYRLDLTTNRNSLLLRVGQKISKIIWDSDKNYLIYTTNDGLSAYDPETGLSTRIFGGSISNPVLNINNDIVYFWTKIGHQSGIYSLDLK